MSIHFMKMQGIGNDFIVINALTEPVTLSPALVQQLADRHFGIGCDQLLLIEPSRQPGVDFSYRIFNTDGSEVGQCGNGARCVGQFLWDNGLTDKPTIVLGTKERNIEVQRTVEGVKANMGQPLLAPQDVPFLASDTANTYTIQVSGETFTVGVVSMGNPHAVMSVTDVATAPVNQLGEALQHHPAFPERVNVGFMQYLNRNQIRLRVYERGVGETLACGSGACAAVVVGQLLGKLAQQVQVILPGGELTVTWQGLGHPVWLTGSSEIVFRGEWLKNSH